MNIDHVDEIKLKTSIKSVLTEILGDGHQVFVFGSRVTGKNMKRSDIDIGVQGQAPVSLEIFAKAREALENLPYLYKFDLVDFAKADEDFKKVAMQKIEIL